MTTNTNPDGVPRWAATAGRRSLAQRVAAHGARLFGSSKRRPTDREQRPDDRQRGRVVGGPPARPARVPHCHPRPGTSRVRGPGARRVQHRSGALRLSTPTSPDQPIGAASAVADAAGDRAGRGHRGEADLPVARRGGVRHRRDPAAAHRHGAAPRPATRRPDWKACGHGRRCGRSCATRSTPAARSGDAATMDSRVPRAQWVWSQEWVHPPLITVAEFTAANRHQWLADTPPTDNGALTSAELPDRRAA